MEYLSIYPKDKEALKVFSDLSNGKIPEWIDRSNYKGLTHKRQIFFKAMIDTLTPSEVEIIDKDEQLPLLLYKVCKNYYSLSSSIFEFVVATLWIVYSNVFEQLNKDAFNGYILNLPLFVYEYLNVVSGLYFVEELINWLDTKYPGLSD